MNVYDQAHLLAKALQESQEYVSLKQLDARLRQDPQINALMRDFRRRQFEVQSSQMMGEQVSQDQLVRLQELNQSLMQDESVSEYFHAELRFTKMMSDIYKILGESIELDELFRHDAE